MPNKVKALSAACERNKNEIFAASVGHGSLCYPPSPLQIHHLQNKV
jgi:hypothetical protein